MALTHSLNTDAEKAHVKCAQWLEELPVNGYAQLWAFSQKWKLKNTLPPTSKVENLHEYLLICIKGTLHLPKRQKQNQRAHLLQSSGLIQIWDTFPKYRLWPNNFSASSPWLNTRQYVFKTITISSVLTFGHARKEMDLMEEGGWKNSACLLLYDTKLNHPIQPLLQTNIETLNSGLLNFPFDSNIFKYSQVLAKDIPLPLNCPHGP